MKGIEMNVSAPAYTANWEARKAVAKEIILWQGLVEKYSKDGSSLLESALLHLVEAHDEMYRRTEEYHAMVRHEVDLDNASAGRKLSFWQKLFKA